MYGYNYIKRNSMPQLTLNCSQTDHHAPSPTGGAVNTIIKN